MCCGDLTANQIAHVNCGGCNVTLMWASFVKYFVLVLWWLTVCFVFRFKLMIASKGACHENSGWIHPWNVYSTKLMLPAMNNENSLREMRSWRQMESCFVHITNFWRVTKHFLHQYVSAVYFMSDQICTCSMPLCCKRAIPNDLLQTRFPRSWLVLVWANYCCKLPR